MSRSRPVDEGLNAEADDFATAERPLVLTKVNCTDKVRASACMSET